MIVLFYILALCYARGGVCVMERVGETPRFVEYHITSQLCSMTQIMENITTDLGALIVVKNSTFVFDYDLPIPCSDEYSSSECREGFNDVTIQMANTVAIFNVHVNIRRIEFDSGSLELNSDIHVQQLVFTCQVQDFFKSIIPNRRTINYYEIENILPYGLIYNVPSGIKLSQILSANWEITNLRTCPVYRPLQAWFDHFCPDRPMITDLYVNDTTGSPTCASQTTPCPECNCTVCQECQECETCQECQVCQDCPVCQECEQCPVCQECEVCQVCQECPTCPVCQECEVCEVCQECPECNCPECPQPVCPQPEEPSKTITITIGKNPNNQVIAFYDDESDDKRGIVWMGNEVLFVFQATYNRYSIDGCNKEWY